jgi:hypothetical protein
MNNLIISNFETFLVLMNILLLFVVLLGIIAFKKIKRSINNKYDKYLPYGSIDTSTWSYKKPWYKYIPFWYWLSRPFVFIYKLFTK